MKTVLGYLTFAVLLALCYIEKINAEAAKRQSRATMLHAAGRAPAWEARPATVAQVRE